MPRCSSVVAMDKDLGMVAVLKTVLKTVLETCRAKQGGEGPVVPARASCPGVFPALHQQPLRKSSFKENFGVKGMKQTSRARHNCSRSSCHAICHTAITAKS